MQIIGITGKARSGKDTIANIIETENRTRKISFAAPIKEAFRAVFGWHPDSYPDRKEQRIPGFYFTPREAMQTLGTEWGRNLQSDLWLRIAQSKIESARVMENQYKYIVITDVRFDNEADLIRNNGGFIIEVVRNDRDEVAAHSSEDGLAEAADFTIFNDGSLKELKDNVFKVLASAKP